MNTIKSITLILGVLTLGWSTNLNAAVEEFNFDEETYIDDIPFLTDDPTTTCNYQMALVASFDFEEEVYVDDIPFNTKCVSTNSRYQKATTAEFNFEEEPYIDDIPFDTSLF